MLQFGCSLRNRRGDLSLRGTHHDQVHPDRHRGGGGAAWCEAAEKWKELLARGLNNFLVTSVANLENFRAGITSLGDLERKEGWLTLEGPVKWATYFHFTVEAQQEFKQKYEKLFLAAGQAQLAPELIKKVTQMREELRVVVEKLASTLQMPSGAGATHYSIGLAKSKIKRWHPDARIIRAAAADPVAEGKRLARDLGRESVPAIELPPARVRRSSFSTKRG